MFKIKVFSVGKTKETWLEDALDEYLRRLKPITGIEFIWAKNDEQLEQLVEKEHLYLCLDPIGKMYTSEEFSDLLQQKLVEGGSRLSFVIGGAEGLPTSLKGAKSTLLSLSPMTLTHQITRLVLLEQIYRAFEIAKGSPYHK